tara:strand:+ start:207 stop:959 length:753 start_codon:yes stop_codon:yes gene_type:complete
MTDSLFDMTEKEARRLGFALQAHALTISSDATRPILGSVDMEFTESGFTLTSTDSYILLHTVHTLDNPASFHAWGESALLTFTDKPGHGFRDLGKALAGAQCRAGETVGFHHNEDSDSFTFDGGGVYAPPLQTCEGDFPKWRTLWPDVSPELWDMEPGTSRAVNLGSRLLMVMAKVHGLAVKAAKVDGVSGQESVMILEPGLKETGPIPFYFSQLAGHWHGIVMPTKISHVIPGINEPRRSLIPEAVRNV